MKKLSIAFFLLLTAVLVSAQLDTDYDAEAKKFNDKMDVLNFLIAGELANTADEFGRQSENVYYERVEALKIHYASFIAAMKSEDLAKADTEYQFIFNELKELGKVGNVDWKDDIDIKKIIATWYDAKVEMIKSKQSTGGSGSNVIVISGDGKTNGNTNTVEPSNPNLNMNLALALVIAGIAVMAVVLFIVRQKSKSAFSIILLLFAVFILLPYSHATIPYEREALNIKLKVTQLQLCWVGATGGDYLGNCTTSSGSGKIIADGGGTAPCDNGKYCGPAGGLPNNSDTHVLLTVENTGGSGDDHLANGQISFPYFDVYMCNAIKNVTIQKGQGPVSFDIDCQTPNNPHLATMNTYTTPAIGPSDKDVVITHTYSAEGGYPSSAFRLAIKLAGGSSWAKVNPQFLSTDPYKTKCYFDFLTVNGTPITYDPSNCENSCSLNTLLLNPGDTICYSIEYMVDPISTVPGVFVDNGSRDPSTAGPYAYAKSSGSNLRIEAIKMTGAELNPNRYILTGESQTFDGPSRCVTLDKPGLWWFHESHFTFYGPGQADDFFNNVPDWRPMFPEGLCAGIKVKGYNALLPKFTPKELHGVIMGDEIPVEISATINAKESTLPFDASVPLYLRAVFINSSNLILEDYYITGAKELPISVAAGAQLDVLKTFDLSINDIVGVDKVYGLIGYDPVEAGYPSSVCCQGTRVKAYLQGLTPSQWVGYIKYAGYFDGEEEAQPFSYLDSKIVPVNFSDLIKSANPQVDLYIPAGESKEAKLELFSPYPYGIEFNLEYDSSPALQITGFPNKVTMSAATATDWGLPVAPYANPIAYQVVAANAQNKPAPAGVYVVELTANPEGKSVGQTISFNVYVTSADIAMDVTCGSGGTSCNYSGTGDMGIPIKFTNYGGNSVIINSIVVSYGSASYPLCPGFVPGVTPISAKIGSVPGQTTFDGTCSKIPGSDIGSGGTVEVTAVLSNGDVMKDFVTITTGGTGTTSGIPEVPYEIMPLFVGLILIAVVFVLKKK